MSMTTAFSVSRNGFFEGWSALHARSNAACQARHALVLRHLPCSRWRTLLFVLSQFLHHSLQKYILITSCSRVCTETDAI